MPALKTPSDSPRVAFPQVDPAVIAETRLMRHADVDDQGLERLLPVVAATAAAVRRHAGSGWSLPAHAGAYRSESA